jgi:putative transcriptional regulator
MARLFLLLLLLLGAVPPAFAADDGSIFLVARKDLPDPFFRDSVVLVTHRIGPVPVGIIINRPTGITFARALPDLEKTRDGRVFFGGPVSPEDLLVVFRAATAPKDAIELIDGVYLSANRDVLKEVLGRKADKGVRIFAGYAAWSPGQLEAEIARGDWHLARADAKSIFEGNPEELWLQLERRAAAKKALLPLH